MIKSDVPLPPLPHSNGAIQIRLIRDDAAHSDVARWDSIYPIAVRALGRQDEGGAGLADSFGTVIKTVVQLNVSSPCKLGSTTSTIDAVEEAFEWGLDCLRELLFRYRQATHSYALVPARENLPPTIWMNRVAYRLDGTVFEDPGMGAFGPGGHGIEEMGEDILSVEELRDILSMAWDSYEDAIFQRFNTFTLDGHEAFFVNGDYRAAVLNAATAAECLLDDVLSHALWWEGLSPQQATPALTKPIFKRVKTEFPSRFGGAWLPARRGPVLDWHNKVARYRDRIIHGGYQPTREEAEAALKALSGLRTFIGKRVIAKEVRRKYKYLPLLLLGKDKLAKQGVDPNPLLEWYTGDQNFGGRFDKWRAVCRRLRIESFSGTLEPELDKVPVFAVITKDKIAHYGVDIPVAMAAEIRIPRLLNHERTLLEEEQKRMKSSESHLVLPFVDMGVKDRVMVSDQWYSAEDILPGYDFMRP